MEWDVLAGFGPSLEMQTPIPALCMKEAVPRGSAEPRPTARLNTKFLTCAPGKG